MLIDPSADRRWIGGRENACRLLGLHWIFLAIEIHNFCSMKAEDCPPSDADSVAWHGDQDESAGGKTGAIDDYAFPGLAQFFEKGEIRKRIAAGAAFYPHVAGSDVNAGKQ